jgi:hypothetical protein
MGGLDGRRQAALPRPSVRLIDLIDLMDPQSWPITAEVHGLTRRHRKNPLRWGSWAALQLRRPHLQTKALSQLQSPSIPTTHVAARLSPRLRMSAITSKAGAALRSCARQQLSTIRAPTALAAAGQRRFDSTAYGDTTKIPNFGAYRSKRSETDNRVFQYLMAGTFGAITAMGAKATVVGTIALAPPIRQADQAWSRDKIWLNG